MYQIDDNPICRSLRAAEKWIDDLYDGRIYSLLLCGPAGVGKSRLASEVAAQRNIPIVKPRPGTPRGMLNVLQEYANVPVILLDDIDWVWGSEVVMNILKLALDNNPPRVLSHEVGGYDHSIEPFEITARVLFISNKNFENPADFSKRTWESGVLPLKSRSAVMPIPFDPEALYHYVGWLCTAQRMLRGLYFDYPVGGTMRAKSGEMVAVTHGNRRRFLARDEANDVLLHFAVNAHRYPSISPREIVRFATARIGKTSTEWEQQVEPLLTGKWALGNLVPYEIT